MATKKKPSTALVPWEQEMKDRAARAAKTEVVRGGIKKISMAGGILKVDDEPVEGNSLDVVVLAFAYENQYYKTAYNPNALTVPACYAFSDPDASGDVESAMAPNPEAEEPQGDDDGKCEGCWANQMGSADIGRGKACKNIRRLIVVTPDALESAEAMAEAEMRMVNVPVMSAKLWSKYVHKLDELGRPPEGVITTIAPVPDPKSQFLVTFALSEMIEFTQETWDALNAKREEAIKELTTAYPKQADLDAAQPVTPRGRMANRMAAKTPAKKAGAKKF